MRKKILTLLLVASTISSTLMPAQSVFADTTGSTDVTIEESSVGNKPTPTPATISTELFHEIKAADYKKLKDIPYSEIQWGTNPDGSPLKRGEIESETDSKIEGLKVSDAYPISHEDIYKQVNDDPETKEKREAATLSMKLLLANNYHAKYEFTGYHYASELSSAALKFINSQQSTYRQETGDCSLNAVTELTNKTLIAQGFISQVNDNEHPNSIRNTRMSRAQISYNALFVTKDPLDGFHGDYSGNNGHYTTAQKTEIVERFKGKKKEDLRDGDLRSSNSTTNVVHSLYSGMGPVTEKAVNDTKGANLCNVGSIPDEDCSDSVSQDNDLCTEDVYNNYAHLTQKREFDKNNQRNLIKAWIYKYGAVGVGTTKKGEEIPLENCNFEYNSMYNYTAAHAMVIVGWDDTFPAEAFNTSKDPNIKAKDGAWLVKNSQNGSADNINDIDYIYRPEEYNANLFNDYSKFTPFSPSRYFWLSYDSITSHDFYGIVFDSKDYFDNIYQYDGYQKNFEYNDKTKLIDSSIAANTFTVKNPDIDPKTSNNAQELKCIGFETNKAGTYQVEIYKKNHDEKIENESPTDGTCIYRNEFNCHKGINTTELINSSNRLLFAPGDRYSVVITAKNGGKITIEDNEDPNDSRDTHKGESFVFNEDTKRWEDLRDKDEETTKKGIKHWPENLRIKAMTVNTDSDSSTIDTTPVDPTPTVVPTSTPVSDCAKLDVKAKVAGSHTGFECTVETDENSPWADQVQYLRITKTDGKGTEKTTKTSLSYAKTGKTANGNIAHSLFLPIDPDAFENTIKIELRDNENHPVKFILSNDDTNARKTAYSTSMKEYLDKLKKTAIANNDGVTEDFANALLIHMACAQSMYKTETNSENEIDLSALETINTNDFASYKLKRGTTDNADGSLPQIGLTFNWKNTNVLSLVYRDVIDPSTIKSIQIDGEDITNSNPKEYHFEEMDDQHELTISLSDIPICEFTKTHTITVENTSGKQLVLKASVYSYIYSTLKTKYVDQNAKNYAKSLALLEKSYNQLNKNDTRYKDIFLF